MSRIEIVPYSTIEDHSYVPDTVISISAGPFAGVPFEDGKITFTFIGCRFRKVFIENSEDINFENISIQFIACYLEDLQVENILSQNISIHFFSSILSGRISSPNLKSVNINNCVGRGVFFLDQNRVDISYTEENVFPKYWRKLHPNRPGSRVITIPVTSGQSFNRQQTTAGGLINTHHSLKASDRRFFRKVETIDKIQFGLVFRPA